MSPTKRLNRSRCRLGADSCGPEEPCIRRDVNALFKCVDEYFQRRGRQEETRRGAERYLTDIELTPLSSVPIGFELHFFSLIFFLQKTPTHVTYHDPRPTPIVWCETLQCFAEN